MRDCYGGEPGENTGRVVLALCIITAVLRVVFRRGYLRRSLQEPARQADVLSSTAATEELVQSKAALPSEEADSEPGGLGIGL